MHSDLVSLSYLTQFFQDIIKDRFDSYYDVGLSIDRIQRSRFVSRSIRDLLDLDNPEGAGIYDPNRAKEIERRAFRSRINFNNTYRAILVKEGRPIE